MFWDMDSLSSSSPVDTILQRKSFTLEDLLDVNDIVPESKTNWLLVDFLREREQLKKLIEYIVEEAPNDAEKQQSFKYSTIACEIFICGTDIILRALVEDMGLMDQLFSFLNPERSHIDHLAGHFSKVVICLLMRMTDPIMNYIQDRQDDIIKKLVDLIGITSIMELLKRLLGADWHIYPNHPMLWLEPNVLDMILDKFSSSENLDVHDNAAEILCAIIKFVPPKLGLNITSSRFISSLLHHAFEDSRPKSVLVNLLSVCISLLNLDPERITSGKSYMDSHQLTHGSGAALRARIVEVMLKSLGDLLKLLDYSSDDNVLLTTYGKLEPPVGKERVKVVEFITVLVAVSSEAAEKEMIHLGVVKHIIKMFFEYPFNNFLHHHVENIIISFLESTNPQFVQHVLRDCNLIEKILEAEINQELAIDTTKPTKAAEGKTQPRRGNFGHITRIANKIVQLGNSNIEIFRLQQENSNWVYWETNQLLKRNTVENVHEWACGRPRDKKRCDHLRDSDDDDDDDDFQGRKHNVPILTDSLSKAVRCGAYNKDGTEEAHGSLSTHEPVLSLWQRRKKSNSDRSNLANASRVFSRKLPLEKQDEMSPEGYNQDAYIDVEIPEELRPSPIHPINNLNDQDHPDSISDIAGLTWFDYKFLEETYHSDSPASPDSDSADKSTTLPSPSSSGGDARMVFEEEPDDVLSEKKDDNKPVDYGSTYGRRGVSLDFKEIDDPATNMEEVGTEDTSEHAESEKLLRDELDVLLAS